MPVHYLSPSQNGAGHRDVLNNRALCLVLRTPSHHESYDRRPVLNTHTHTAAPQIQVPYTQGKSGSCGLPSEQLHISVLTPVAPDGQSPTSMPLLSLQELPTGCAPDLILPLSLLRMRPHPSPHLTSQDRTPSVLPSSYLLCTDRMSFYNHIAAENKGTRALGTALPRTGKDGCSQ